MIIKVKIELTWSILIQEHYTCRKRRPSPYRKGWSSGCNSASWTVEHDLSKERVNFAVIFSEFWYSQTEESTENVGPIVAVWPGLAIAFGRCLAGVGSHFQCCHWNGISGEWKWFYSRKHQVELTFFYDPNVRFPGQTSELCWAFP